MANDNSQSNKVSRKKIFSNVAKPISSFFNNTKRSSSPAPSDGSQEHSSRSLRKLIGKFTSTSPSQSKLSLALPPSTENPGRGTPLGKYRIFSMYILNCNPILDSSSSTVPAPDSMSPNHPSMMVVPSQYPDHITPPASLGSHPSATSPAVQGE
jgi:hypothetical protein